MNISNKKLILIALIVCAVVIFLLVGFAFANLLISKDSSKSSESIIGILLAIMSIVIMLGVAFSFVSIFDAKDDIQRLTDLVNESRETKDQVNRMLQDLKQNTLSSKIALASCEIMPLDMAATSFYHEGRFLQAIKKEFEVIDYISRNSEYCVKISESYWGMKRYAISNDIMMLIKDIIDNGMPKFDFGEFDDIMSTITGKIDNLYSCKSFKSISQGEHDRYYNLMYWIKSILTNLNRSKLDFEIDFIAYRTIYIYTKIKDGHNGDNQVILNAEAEERLKKEYSQLQIMRQRMVDIPLK